MYRNIIFDFDGTLVDSSEDIILCLKDAYNMARIPLQPEIKQTIIGPPLKEMILLATPEVTENEIDNIIKEFRLLYDKSDYENTKPYSGVYEILKVLQEKGLKLFIATNKPQKPTNLILKKFNMNIFLDVVTPDIGNSIDKKEMIKYLLDKWKLHPGDSIIVGDGVSDMIAGKSNGVITVAALYGYTPGDELRACNCEYYIESINDLPAVVFL